MNALLDRLHGLLDSEGRPLDPVTRAESELATMLAESLYGGGPGQRVRELRASILGTSAAPTMTGLAYWLKE